MMAVTATGDRNTAVGAVVVGLHGACATVKLATKTAGCLLQGRHKNTSSTIVPQQRSMIVTVALPAKMRAKAQ